MVGVVLFGSPLRSAALATVSLIYPAMYLGLSAVITVQRRSRLEASEFHPVVMHELSALSLDGYAMAAGGILVQVPEEEVAAAQELLASKPPESEAGPPTEGTDSAPL